MVTIDGAINHFGTLLTDWRLTNYRLRETEDDGLLGYVAFNASGPIPTLQQTQAYVPAVTGIEVISDPDQLRATDGRASAYYRITFYLGAYHPSRDHLS